MKRMALDRLHEARGARLMEYHGWEIPAWFSSVQEEYLALQEGVGLIDLSYRTQIRISGRDRRTWLHGQVTQDINGLPDWHGTYATVLTPQGRMVTDLCVYALPDCLLLDVPAGTETPIAEYLDRFLIMERAEIEDLTDEWALLSLQGPRAQAVLTAFLGEDVMRLEPWQVGAFPCGEETMYVVRISHTGEDGFDLWAPSTEAANLWGDLCRHRREFAVHSVGWEAHNLRRVEAGIPSWGAELDSSIVPLEARLDHAIHYQKGCYVGQEIIARIEARGHVNNLLAGFLIPAENPPARGAELQHGGKKVGVLRTIVRSPKLERLVGLGYLRRELQEPGTRVRAGEAELEVTSLPFVPHDLPDSYTMPPVC